MERNTTFTEGKILQPLILFAMPVLFALFLQAFVVGENLFQKLTFVHSYS